MRSAVALFLAAAMWVPHTLSAAAPVRIGLVVRVYQTAGLPPSLEQRALTEAGAILRAALVDVSWRLCSPPFPSPACDLRPGPSERRLRIVREDARASAQSVTLGAALVEPRVGGVLVTVYFDEVARLARKTGVDTGVLLGRAVAHELGHLLMRTTAHPPCGLMRSDWTQSELRRRRAVDWAFTGGDVATMHAPPTNDSPR